MHIVTVKNPSKNCAHDSMPTTFSSKSEASASELLENVEEMFPHCYIDSDVISRLNYSTTR